MTGRPRPVVALSFIPASALLLAEASHAPNGEFIVLDSDYYNPFVGGKDFHYLAQRGKLDLFFMSGIEIDREANFNLHLIGDPDSPEVRMPGQYGTGLLYYAVPRIVLFRTRHDRRTFVEKVDYVSAASASPEGFARRTKEVVVITPLAKMELSRELGILELVSVHEGHTLEEVRENTGFELKIKGGGETAPMTPIISDEELHLLRTRRQGSNDRDQHLPPRRPGQDPRGLEPRSLPTLNSADGGSPDYGEVRLMRATLRIRSSARRSAAVAVVMPSALARAKISRRVS